MRRFERPAVVCEGPRGGGMIGRKHLKQYISPRQDHVVLIPLL
jgi:hypothetical protein